eukprot:XP_002528209.2 WAT1-related protein At4g30420 [Ricinus communis]
MGGLLDEYMPEIAMFGLQFSFAGATLITRAALVQGMSPRVFVVYRQAIATLIVAPLAYFSRVHGYLVPAITFIMAAIMGIEKINIRSLRSIAKIVGTVLCVTGAISMALLRGTKLLNTSILGGENWLVGCLFLFGSACCWSFWLILQVPVTSSYPDHLSLSAWMCFLATIQSAVATIFLERDLNQWKLHSYLELICCLFAGIVSSGLSFFLQAWCISQRGPLFTAMFNPLGTVIVTVCAAMFLHEEIYMGSLIGAVGVIIGLYVVLWSKAKDVVRNEEDKDPKLKTDQMHISNILIDESMEEGKCRADLQEPLLPDKSNYVGENNLHQSHI